MEQRTIDQIEKAVELLEEGQVLLTYVRPVEGDKFSVEFAERITSESTNTLLQIGNFDDERFQNGNSPRRAWGNFSEAGLKKVFKIDLSNLKLQTKKKANGQKMEVYAIGLANPTAGRPIHLEVRERKQSELVPYSKNEETGEVIGSKWDTWALENVEQAAKNNGRGSYMVADGELVFSRVLPTNAKVRHTFVEHDSTTTEPEKYLIPNVVIQADDAEEAFVGTKKEKEVETTY